MALSDKVNLQVKVVANDNNYVQYAFKFISYENTVVNLNDYRIVCYFNTFRSQSIFVQNRILNGYGSGTTSGALSNTAGYTNQEFFTPEYPPKIYPTNQRYDKEIILPLSGTAACLTAGSYWDNIIFQISFNSGQYFISENIGSPSYLVGQIALSEGYTYLPVTETSYVDNDSFVLEYNDPTYGWVKVTEYSDASTIDASTGKYPYDTIFEEKKALGDVNRQYGWDTSYDHDGLIASYDGYIDEYYPTSAFSDSTTYSLNGSGTSNPTTRIGLYKFSTAALTDKIVSAAEFYVFQPSSNQVTTIDCRLNAVDYDGDASWNEMSGWAGTSGTLQSQIYIDAPFQFQNSYIAYNLDKNIVQEWQDSSATNFGINLRYDDATGKNGYNSPTMNTLENSDVYKPTMFVYSGPISAQSGSYIRWEGNTDSNWSVASNWEGGVVPTSIDYAVFDESFSTCACVLDGNYDVKNILGTSAGYTGSIDFSGNALTIYDTVNAFDISDFTSASAISATFEFKGNIDINVPNQFLIKNMILTNGGTFLSEDTIIGTLLLKNSSTLNCPYNYYRLFIRDVLLFEIGNETINTIQLYVDKGATIPNNGTLNTTFIKYLGSAKITARTYNCPVGYTIPQKSDYSYELECSAVFVSAGACVFNNGFYISDNSYHSAGESVCTLDFDSNGNTFSFNTFSMGTANDHDEGIVIIFPTGNVSLSGDLLISTSMLSATSNYDNCTFVLKGNNTISQSVTSADKFAMFPALEKFDAGTVTINSSYLTDKVIFDYITFGSILSATVPVINFNSSNLFATNNMTIAANDSSIQNIGGSLLSATNVYLYKNSSTSGAFVSETPWSAYATTELQSDGILLSDSIAASATGYAIRSSDLGDNVNWFFDTIPPIILETSAVPSHYSQSPISAYYTITDEGGFDANTITVSNNFGDLINMVQHSPTCATFMVVISGDYRCGELEISAIDYSGNISEFTSLPFSYDNIPPSIEILSYSPATGVSNAFIDIIISAHDNCILSGSHQVFSATFNSQPAQINSINFSDYQNATAAVRISSTTPVNNGDFYISALDAAGNTGTLYSSAFTITTLAPQITFESDPSFKVGSTVILVSATFEDTVGMSQTIPYNMAYNGINIPFSTIYDSSTKVILSAVIPSNRGAGNVSVTGFNTAGISAVGTDFGYSFIPVIIFGDPVPSNISKTTITVPISAIGPFVNESNYYYVRLSGTRMPISEPTSGVLSIFGYDFECLSFSATVSSMSDLYGDLIISASYR